VKATRKPTEVVAPPGLGGFEVLSCEKVFEEEGKRWSWMQTGEDRNNDPSYEEEYPAMKAGERKGNRPRMNNYSKRQVRFAKEGGKGCFMLQKAPEAKPLNPFLAPSPDREGWVKVTGVMDSGASESVAPPSMCPHYPVEPSPGSLIGQKYISASDDLIDNMGQQHLEIVTGDGSEGVAKYQVAEVSRPLNAVSEICDAGGEHGQVVMFGKYGGEILNLESGKRTPFNREDGVYTWDFWVKPKGVGFPRQG